MEKKEQVKVLLHTTSKKKHSEIYRVLVANGYDVYEVAYLAEIHDRNLLNQFQIVISSIDTDEDSNGIEFLNSILHIDNIVQRIILFDPSVKLEKLERVVNKAHVDYLLFFPIDETAFLKVLKKAARRFRELTKPIQNYEYLVHYTQDLHQNVIKFQHEASTDALTKLMNRRAFDAFIKRIWQRYEENNSSFSLAILDLDFFKRVNDQYGHPVGDMVLRKVGDIILGNQRLGVDYAFRYGGEEFAIISLNTNHKNMTLYINRILQAVREAEVKTDRGAVKITFSAGVAQADYFTRVADLIKAADDTLYRAKEEGRDRVIDKHR
jgi:diguanylate cyclase (GGDEF)-like protein